MLILILYAIFGVLFWRALSKSSSPSSAIGIYTMVRFLLLIHGLILFGRSLDMVQVYRRDIFEVMAWLPLFLYLLCSKRNETMRLLHVLWPMSFLLVLVSAMVEHQPLLSSKAMEHIHSVYLHIVLAIGGFSSFLLVSLCACCYLWQRWLLKKHRNALVLNFMPSLIELGAIQWRALFVGIILLTSAIGLGKLSPHLWGIPHEWGAKEILTVLIWTNYMVLACLRKHLMVHKDRFAQGALIGLVMVILSFFFMGLMGESAPVEDIYP